MFYVVKYAFLLGICTELILLFSDVGDENNMLIENWSKIQITLVLIIIHVLQSFIKSSTILPLLYCFDNSCLSIQIYKVAHTVSDLVNFHFTCECVILLPFANVNSICIHCTLFLQQTAILDHIKWDCMLEQLSWISVSSAKFDMCGLY